MVPILRRIAGLRNEKSGAFVPSWYDWFLARYTHHVTIFDTSLQTFDQDVLAASCARPVLVDFWAEWCSPCLVLAPVLERVMRDPCGALVLAKLEVDQGGNMKLAGQDLVRGFPTVILFDDGRETGRFSGARSRTRILSFIRDHVVIAGPV